MFQALQSRGHTFLAVTAVAAAISASAQATVWTMTFNSVTPGQTVGINYDANRAVNAANAGTYGNVSAGQLNWTGPYGKSYITYCTQLTEHISYGQTLTFTQALVQNVPDVTPGAMGAVKAALVRDLYARNYADVIASADSALHAAFQAVLWEITHENLTGATAALAAAELDLSLGALQLNGSGANAGMYGYAVAMIESLGDGGFQNFGGLLGLTHSQYQDQLVVVPIPAPVVLAGLGLLGVGVLRRRYAK
ncbi:MAG: hypothetical protein SGJ11_00990 [Phycisphaerae bacterium]|nr:hypothetical protein [Phycisphaerae bacterium]